LCRRFSQVDLVGLLLLKIIVEHSMEESRAVTKKSLWQEVALSFYLDFDSGAIKEIIEDIISLVALLRWSISSITSSCLKLIR
jgi:hypothetical protein